MENKIRIGLIGASWFADLWFLPVLKKHPEVTVAAICSKNGKNANAMAEKYGIPAVYASASEMMENAQLDGVCIITPNDTHHPLAMEAIARGLHVLCEKPLALNGRQSAEMREAAVRRGIVHGVNFSCREHPGVQYLRLAVREGRIGQLLEGRFEYSGDYARNGSPGWRGSVKAAGAGGILQDLGSHMIDLAHYVTGDRIKTVQASVRCLESGQLVDFADRKNPDQAGDSVLFEADFEAGGHGLFHTSWVKPQGNGGQTIVLELYGTEGSLQLTFTGYGAKLMQAQAGKAWTEIFLPDVLGWDLQAEAGEDRFRPYRNSEKNEAWRWAEAIAAAKSGKGLRDEAGNRPSFEDGDDVQQVIDAVLLSAETKRKTAVGETEMIVSGD